MRKRLVIDDPVLVFEDQITQLQAHKAIMENGLRGVEEELRRARRFLRAARRKRNTQAQLKRRARGKPL